MSSQGIRPHQCGFLRVVECVELGLVAVFSRLLLGMHGCRGRLDNYNMLSARPSAWSQR